MRPDLGAVFIAAALALVFLASQQPGWSSAAPDPIDNQLTRQLRELGFTGRIESTLAARLGRHVDPPLADIGRLLWFDTVIGLKGDNTCAGCHSPTNGFGDSQPIAVGIDNNGIVGPDRAGPRNMRRAPMVLNTAFFPSLMWNSRFSSRSGDPFDNHAGFEFPLPEGMTLSAESHLLIAQAFIPPTERTEAAGFDFPGDNNAMRAEVVRRVDRVTDYRRLFAERFPSVRAGAPIDYDMFARAIAEFEFSLTFANAPIDRYARGDIAALDDTEKGGAILFFGKTRCVECHSVSGAANEMFTDFGQHAIGVPQLVPRNTNKQLGGRVETNLAKPAEGAVRIVSELVSLRFEPGIARSRSVDGPGLPPDMDHHQALPRTATTEDLNEVLTPVCAILTSSMQLNAHGYVSWTDQLSCGCRVLKAIPPCSMRWRCSRAKLASSCT